MKKPRILAFAGSLRKDSYNKMLVKIAAEGARKAGGEVTVLDLADFPSPIYNADLEKAQGIPELAKRFKDLMIASDAFLIAPAEYNSSITAALKNMIDWASRPEGDEPSLVAFTGKVAGLLCASPGYYGGARSLVHVRSILSSINVLVLPDQVTVPKAHEFFDAEGNLNQESKRKQALALGAKLAEVTSKLMAE